MIYKTALLSTALFLCGCLETHVVIDQPKPMEFNFNVSGQINVVIQDARQDMEKITGEKPTNQVSPEDLGLKSGPGAALAPEGRTLASASEEALLPVALPMRRKAEQRGEFSQMALKDDLRTKMAARDKEIRALWDSQAVGESHEGLVVVKGTVTPEQQSLIDAENADRKALFAEETKERKQSAEDVALAFYIARLGYAKKGAWYEKRNTAGTWEWKHWEK